MHLIRKYFNDQKWTIDDFKQTEWAGDHRFCSLGNEKDQKKLFMPINCNGVFLDARAGKVHIATFNERGAMTRPSMHIHYDKINI